MEVGVGVKVGGIIISDDRIDRLKLAELDDSETPFDLIHRT
jgi:hypothetical protein